ncbi:hypothetical protein TKK_0009361 [Trichogramma kaykai]
MKCLAIFLILGACVLVASAAPKDDKLRAFEKLVHDNAAYFELSDEEQAAFIENAYNETNIMMAYGLNGLLELREELDEMYGEDDSTQPILSYNYETDEFEYVEPEAMSKTEKENDKINAILDLFGIYASPS